MDLEEMEIIFLRKAKETENDKIVLIINWISVKKFG